MLQLILIRPGLTDYDHQRRIQGRLDIPLSEAGRREAAEAADALRRYLPSTLYFAPGAAAEETAAIIGESLDLRPKKLERLLNLDQGLWQGMLVDEIRHKQPKLYKQWQEHPETVCPPQGETLADAMHRVEEVFEKLARKHRSGAIAVVVPEPLAAILRHRLAGTELGNLWHVPAAGCQIDVHHIEPLLAGTSAHAAGGFDAGHNPAI